MPEHKRCSSGQLHGEKDEETEKGFLLSQSEEKLGILAAATNRTSLITRQPEETTLPIIYIYLFQHSYFHFLYHNSYPAHSLFSKPNKPMLKKLIKPQRVTLNSFSPKRMIAQRKRRIRKRAFQHLRRQHKSCYNIAASHRYVKRGNAEHKGN